MAEGMDRREFLRGAAGVAAGAAVSQLPLEALATAAGKASAKPVKGGEFLQGVASGQPTHRAMTLWSKLSDVEKAGTVTLEVAKDSGFNRVVERRKVRTQRRSDHSIKTRVHGLDPHERYFYRFATGSQNSPVGQFRTLPPPGSKAPVKIGIFSCQDYVAGFYTAHAGLLAEDLDLVVCLGDYIYERQFYEPQREDTTGANGDGEVQTLPEYRDKYALYHSDENLTSLRGRVPLAAIWDDHEVEDNYADEHPGAATIDPRVDFLKRRRNGYRAYFEHMPFAPAGRREGKKNRFRIYRSVKLGHTAELLLLDQRQYRDEQPCGDTIPPTPPCTDAERNDPERTYLGKEQMAWLKRRLESSKATWKLVGNQAMIMAFDVPATQPINVDQWDGYGADRAEVMSHIAEKGIEDVSFLTGDIHTFFAGQVSATGRQSAPGVPASLATEFVAGSTTSLGVPETINATTGVPLPPEVQAAVADTVFLKSNNPHFAYSNTERRGYGVVTASTDKLEVEYRSPLTTTEPESTIETIQAFEVAPGVPEVQLV